MYCPIFRTTNPHVRAKRILQVDQIISSTEKANVLGIPVSPSGIDDITLLIASKKEDEGLTITFVNPLACALARQHAD